MGCTRSLPRGDTRAQTAGICKDPTRRHLKGGTADVTMTRRAASSTTRSLPTSTTLIVGGSHVSIRDLSHSGFRNYPDMSSDGMRLAGLNRLWSRLDGCVTYPSRMGCVRKKVSGSDGFKNRGTLKVSVRTSPTGASAPSNCSRNSSSQTKGSRTFGPL